MRILLTAFLWISCCLDSVAQYPFPTAGAPIFGSPSGVTCGNYDDPDQGTWVKVNGNLAGPPPHNEMQGYVTPGSAVDINFNLNTPNNRYTTVTYTVSPSGERMIYDYQSNFFNSTMPVKGNSNQQLVLVPTCKFEIYFVKGCVIRNFTLPLNAAITAAGPAGNPYGANVIDFANGGTGECITCPIIANSSSCVNFRVLEVIDLPGSEGYELIFSVINTIGTINNSCGNNILIGDVLFSNITPTHTANNQPYQFRYNYQLGPVIPGYPAKPNSFVFDQRNNQNGLAYDIYQSEIFRFKISDAEFLRLSTDPVIMPEICAELSNGQPEPDQTTPPLYCAEIDFSDCKTIINPLPVKLLSFEGKRDKNGILLSWKTASEENNDRFEIERSTNGLSFKKTGTVTGKGTTATLSAYAFSDKFPENIPLYYRLKQVDLDGKSTFSPIIVIDHRLVLNLQLQLNPNPCQSRACYLQLQGLETGQTIQLELRDLAGKLRWQKIIKAEAQNILELPALAILPGMYMLSATNGKAVYTQKVLFR